MSARYASALSAMQDGMVLGTILYELLDRFRDFEVVFAHPQTGTQGHDTGAAPDDTRPTEAFYTDAVPGAELPDRWLGDRADLELVAALIQPLSPVAPGEDDNDADDDASDAVLGEEQERRRIDAKKGAATGEERDIAGSATAKAIERASARLARRLGRAASAAEDALAAKDQRKLREIALPHLARQIWMTHIAAFLAGRTTISSDGKEVRCLDEEVFAEYVLRLCHALAGGKAGGLLALLPETAWQAADADHVKRGLAFVETCCLWAVAWVRRYWRQCKDPEVLADGVWDSVPELLAARFLNALRGRVEGPDLKDVERRLPHVLEIGTEPLLACKKDLDAIGAALRDADSQSSSTTGAAVQAWKPGDLASTPHLGATFVVGVENRNIHLLDLSKGPRRDARNTEGDYRRTYVADVVSTVRDPKLKALRWREIYSDNA